MEGFIPLAGVNVAGGEPDQGGLNGWPKLPHETEYRAGSLLYDPLSREPVPTMLVALDTAQLVALADPRTDRGMYREFCGTWVAHNCVLALHDTTIREFVYGGGSNLDGRVQLLRSFGSLQGIPHPDLVYRYELRAYATAIASGETVESYRERVLPELRADLFKSLDPAALEGVIPRVRRSAGPRRDFDGMFAEVLDFKRKVGGLWPPTLLQAMTKEEALKKLEVESEGFPEPYRTHYRQQRTRSLATYYGAPDDRHGFLCTEFDIADLLVSGIAPETDFVEISIMKTLWLMSPERKELIANGVLKSWAHEREVISMLSPYMLPGVSLRMAMQREQERDAGREVEVGDVPDGISLMFAPYVDLACVDKRVFHWITTARTGKESHLLLDGVGSNLVDARNLTRVAEAISSR